jgi:transitional endoplasmic reticulum ATPase
MYPHLYAHEFKTLRCTPSSGILLYGPPGCGKTMCVNAFANACTMNMMHVQSTRLLSKYTGSTEASIRRVFTQARMLAPCVLLIDDIDVIGTSRSRLDSVDTGGTMERIVSTLLNEMDGVDTGSGGVYVVACSTRPWVLDSAIVRPGRLDRLVRINSLFVVIC